VTSRSTGTLPGDLVADDPAAIAQLVERHGDYARHGARATLVLSFALDRARELGALELVGDIEYRLARHAVERSELEVAIGHLDRARDAFEEAGRPEAALRTVLGRMHVLDEYGRHAEVIALGERTVARLLDLGDEPSVVWLRSAVEENVGVACGLMGRHADAMGHYEHALAGYRAIEADDDVARVMANQGCELLDLGHARDAMAAFDSAREFFEADGEALWVAKVDAHRGQAALAMGQLGTAVELLTSACTALGELDAVAERRRATAGLVAAYTELRLVDEAVATADELVADLRSSAAVHDLGTALVARARALLLGGALDAARADLDEATAALTEVGDRGGLAVACTLRARAEAASGDLLAARRSADHAAGVAAELDREADELTARALVVELLAPADPRRASALAAELLPRGADSGLPLLHARIEHVAGLAAFAAGDTDTAERVLAAAVERVATLHEALDTDEWRMRFLHDRRQIHETYADVLLSAGRATDALAVLDQPRRLIGGRRRPPCDDLIASMDALGRATAADRRALVQRVRDLAAQATAPRPPHVPERRGTGGVLDRVPDRTAVVYRVGPSTIGAFVVRGTDTVWIPLCDTHDVRRVVQRIESNWRHRRLMGEAHGARLRAELTALLQHLYSAIFEPLVPWLTDEIDVVADGIVHAVPLAALHDGTEHVVQRYTIRNVGNLSVEVVPPHVPRRQVVAIGRAQDDVPRVDREVSAVAAAYAVAQTITGDDATAERVLDAVRGADVVHIAGHGRFRHDNPGRSAVQLADRWLSADELASAGVDGAIVVVNVCDGGRRDATVGQVEGAGLPQRLLAGGADAVIGPRVALDDRDAADMAAHLHGRLASGIDPASALRAAQLDAHEAGLDPSAWGSFAAHVRRRPVHDRRSPGDVTKEPR
jgi:CHAT domain-containing protein/tetratricopeptide (TPR) repeat protein